MRIAMIGLAALLFQGTQEQPGRAPLMLEIAARGYLAGGRAGSLAGDSAVDRLESYVWVDQTLCSMGAGNSAPPNTPWAGWHFTGNVVSRTADELVVNVEWQRMWEAGRRMSGNQQNRSIRIRAGERVELDRIASANQGACGMLEARLEAGVTTRAAYLMGVPGGMAGGVRGGRGGGVATGVAAGAAGAGTLRGGRGAGGRGGVATAGATGGVGAGGGGGVATGARGGARGGVASAGVAGDPTGMTTAQGAAAAGVQGGRGGQSAAVAGAQGARGGRGQGTGIGMAGGTTLAVGRGSQGYAADQFEAELWLVHKKPDGAEVVQQQTVRFGVTGRPFTFPPFQVAGSGGPITIDISGSLQTLSSTGQRYGLSTGYMAMRGGRGTSQNPAAESTSPLFGVSIARRARRTTPFIDTRGATDISLQTPKPDDVLSFELPALQKSTEDLLKGHTFSIRLRAAPIR